MFQDMAEKSDFLCIKCGADSTEDEGTFCFNCGYELDSNYCPNEMCDRNNGTSMQMPRNYCYCDVFEKNMTPIWIVHLLIKRHSNIRWMLLARIELKKMYLNNN